MKFHVGLSMEVPHITNRVDPLKQFEAQMKAIEIQTKMECEFYRDLYKAEHPIRTFFYKLFKKFSK